MVREARLKASEEALALKEQAERSLAIHRQQLSDTEKQLVKREALINHQLQDIAREEQSLREQQQECQRLGKSLENAAA